MSTNPGKQQQKATTAAVKKSPSVFFQPKLTINEPGDIYEQEADAMADKVMRMADVSGNHDAFFKPANNTVQRCACEEEEKHVHRKENGEAGLPDNNGPDNYVKSLDSSGERMSASSRSFFEPRFGYDFSDVKIHTDTVAAKSAQSVNALAYTTGNNIVFNKGQYAPETPSGQKLMAHELTHVVQQRSTNVSRLIQREKDKVVDPLDILAGYTESTVSTLILDRGSRRVRFMTKGGGHYDGTLTSIANDFANGTYQAEKSFSGDKNRTWNISNNDGTPYRGGLQFDVFFKDHDFDKITYTSPATIVVTSGELAKLIDIDERIKSIAAIAAKFRVGSDEEQQIIRLLADIPQEQSKEFMDKLSAQMVDGKNLVDRLDSVVDGQENMELHEALSKIRLRTKPEEGAKNMANAPVLAWHDVMGFFEQSATFSMEELPDGKIRIKYMGGISSGMYSDPEYKEIADMNKRGRLNWMTDGVTVDASQPIIIHDYDRDKFTVLTAKDLITYQHAGVRKFMENVGTIASFATPVGAETAAGRVLVITMEKVLPAMVLLVEENKLNIKKWFPHWGPAIIEATEKVKIGIAIYGAAQFVKGGWSAFQALKKIRNARKLMDAAAIAKDAAELSDAEKIALQLEQQADGLIGPAEKMQQELSQADAAAGKVTVNSGEADAATAVKPPESAVPLPEDVLKAQQGEVFKGISKETEDLFKTEEGLKLKKLLEENPDVALLIKFCNSPCFPKLTKDQVAKIRALKKLADTHGIPLNQRALKVALHEKSAAEIDDVLEIVAEGLTKKIEGRAPTLPTGTSTMESAEQMRNLPGVASGGDSLKYVKGKWIQDGKIGLFPKQIADKLRGQTFRDFKQFREAFWKLVAEDPDLSPLKANGKSALWSDANLAKMRNGEAPVVTKLPGSKATRKLYLELDHKLALKNEGGVYDLDNIDIVHTEFHDQVGER